MKLQTKFIVVLLSAILLVLVASQVFQQALSTNALKHLGSENLDSLELRERLHAENIFQTANPVIQQTINLGDMPKLDAVIQNFTNIDGILEYSIYDHRGDAAFSSSHEVLKSNKTLPGDMKEKLLSDPAKRSRQTSNAFEIYQPMVATAKCLECHDDFKTGSIGGVAVLRLSTAALAKSEQDWIGATGKIQQTNVTIACLTTVAIAVLFIVLAWLTVGRLITVPLQRIIDHLKQGADRIKLSSDEMASNSRIIAEGSSEQAASLEETSSSLEELSSMTKRNRKNRQKTNELVPADPRRRRQGAWPDMQEMNIGHGRHQGLQRRHRQDHQNH